MNAQTTLMTVTKRQFVPTLMVRILAAARKDSRGMVDSVQV